VLVERDSLDRTLRALAETGALVLQSGNKQEMLRNLSPYFRTCVIIPGHQLTDADLDRELSHVIRDAIADFFNQIPLSEQAYKETIIQFAMAQDRERSIQGGFRERIEAELERMAAVQADMAQRLSYLDPTVMQRESGRPELRNPFRIVKAEEFDHDYPLLASLFQEPSKYDLIRGRDNLIIYGARGCGKSMILRSLEAPAAVEIEARARRVSRLTLEEAELDYLGVYVKLAQGYFHNWHPDVALSQDAATQLFEHVLNMQLLKATVEALLDYRDRYRLITFSPEMERMICERGFDLIGSDTERPSTFAELRRTVVAEERAVRAYLGHLRLGSDASYSGAFTSVSDFPRDFCRVILDSIPELEGSRIYFLLDEFENLAEFQQTVVNTITKLRPDSLTIKLATRALGLKSLVDLQGEAIQTPRDYQMVSLDYDVSSGDYTDLLFQISRKRLEREGCSEHNVTELLPSPEPYPEFGEERVRQLVATFLKERRGIDFAAISEAEQKEWLHRMDVASIFRESASLGRRYWKVYAGFRAFVVLSSGIVSNFLELCKMAFYLAESNGQDVRGGEPIDAKIQSQACYIVSRASLDWIPRNIPETGPMIARLLLDLADIFREKLLRHDTEPEAARLVIKDPERLDEEPFGDVSVVLNDAVRWSVLHAFGPSTAYFPRHKSDVRPNDFALNRILAPTLRLSCRPRWRTEFRVQDIASLLTIESRARRKRELTKKHSGEAGRQRKTAKDNQQSLPFPCTPQD